MYIQLIINDKILRDQYYDVYEYAYEQLEIFFDYHRVFRYQLLSTKIVTSRRVVIVTKRHRRTTVVQLYK